MSPESAQQLAAMMAANHARAESLPHIDLRLMNRVIEFAPDDMTVTVESGISLARLQHELSTQRQWLPIDPPKADTLSIHELLSNDLSGPRRFGFGTIREHLIGMKIVLADGRIIKSGGKVVKNVAGYDLAKLFIGARQSLGLIVEATFKLRPLPEVEHFVCARLDGMANAAGLVRAVLNSELTPIVLDLYHGHDNRDLSIVLGFAGTHAEVDWQLNVAKPLGFTTPGTLDYQTEFWLDSAPVNRSSVLPSRLTEILAALGARPFVARAGNGIIYYRGEAIGRKEPLPGGLMRRVKNAYDPKNILPELAL